MGNDLSSATPFAGSILRLRREVGFVIALLLSACATEVPTGGSYAVTGPRHNETGNSNSVSVCHLPQATPAILEIAGSALDAHLAHGDYVTTLVVSHDDAPTNDGVHFRRITDALAAARAGRVSRNELVDASCRITIAVSPDVYQGTTGLATGDVEQLPFVVDVPDITLRGAMTMEIDAAGRATGNALGGVETILAPVSAMPIVAGVSTPLVIANGHPGGSAGHGLTVEGFVFTSGPNPQTQIGGQGVLGVRVSDITIRGNRFETGYTESIDLRASSGEIVQNHLRGTANCDMCLGGPGNYRVTGNRLLAGGIAGVITTGVVGLSLPAGVEPYELPATAVTWSEVRNNEVRDHLRTPVGVGIRVDVVGTQAPNVHNTVHSIIQDNLIVNNRFGIIIHAGFTPGVANYHGNANVALSGNIIQQSCQTKLMVSLTRQQRTLGLNTTFQFLNNSTYQIARNGDVAWSDVWFDHPAGLGNQLIVDGQPMANGTHQFYSGTGCPGL